MTKHPQEKLITCESCPYKVNYTQNLNTHRISKHSKTKFKCLKCAWETTWKNSFSEHMRYKHGVFQKHSKYKKDMELSESVCDLCGFSATSELSMQLHIKSQCEMKTDLRTNRKNLTVKQILNLLSSTLTSTNKLRRKKKGRAGKEMDNKKPRTRIHRLLTYQCNKCDCTANHRRFMIYHDTLNHSIKAVPKDDILQCALCDFETDCNVKLGTHIREVHDKERNYICSLCDHKTFRRNILVRHIRLQHLNTEAKWLFIGSKTQRLIVTNTITRPQAFIVQNITKKVSMRVLHTIATSACTMLQVENYLKITLKLFMRGWSTNVTNVIMNPVAGQVCGDIRKRSMEGLSI